jgi:RNA recognition motif-containing protein
MSQRDGVLPEFFLLPSLRSASLLLSPGVNKGAKLMSKNLYVGNLAFSTTSADLETLFGQHGKVTSAQVVMDRESGRSRGFGFVEMASGAEEAIKALNLTDFQGRSITVNEARPREERPRGGGGGGYGGGRGGRRY